MATRAPGHGAAGARKTPKIALLLRLLAAIDEGRSDFDGLKRHLDPEHPPSTRSVRRYLAILAEAGFPWYYDRATGRYVFDANYSLRRMELSRNELFGLLAMRGIATSLGGTLGASMDEVAEKVRRISGDAAGAVPAKAALRVQLPDPELDRDRNAGFELLQKAQRDKQSVRFSYVDKAGIASRRHVDVYGFVFSNGRIYAVAHDRGRRALRVFAVDNVSDVRIAPERYSIPPDFELDAFASGSVSGIMHSAATTRVTVRFSAVIAGAARADRVVRDRTIRELPAGEVEIEYAIADADEFVRWAFKWGAQAEITAPPHVREQAASLAQEIARRYAPVRKK